jgi:hypothetical protein
MLGLFVAMFFLMRGNGTPPGIAAILTILLLAAGAARLAMLAGLSDILAAGINYCGIIVVITLVRKPRSSAVLLAATLFALAGLTKVTSIFGILTAIIWLVLQRRSKSAALLAAVFVAELAIGGFVVQWISDGRFISVMRGSALVGGNVSDLADAPVIFFGMLVRNDPVSGLFWLAGVIAAVCSRPRLGIATLLLIATTLATIPIFGTPGTDLNHLIDLDVAAILCVAACLGTSRRISLLPVGIVAAGVLLACGLSISEAGAIEKDPPRAQIERALADAQQAKNAGPLLSENPLLPVLLGERPYMVDAFMFAGFAERDPEITRRLFDDLDHRRFRAVILAPSRGLAEAKLPATFTHVVLPRVEANYQLVATDGRYLVYLPKQ